MGNRDFGSLRDHSNATDRIWHIVTLLHSPCQEGLRDSASCAGPGERSSSICRHWVKTREVYLAGDCHPCTPARIHPRKCGFVEKLPCSLAHTASCNDGMATTTGVPVYDIVADATNISG
ncbi:hypothetical protein SRABI44_02337 [Microbacterium foliorum]|nr:hypothetical protein SRABI44_02337 [Microbacterium foliorum]CAH0242141.1 hypothetical protein SRABI03_02994 [Microbacterium foliorum]